MRRFQMARESRSYSKAEMLAGGFEASCELICGTRYLWNGAEGIRVDPVGRTGWVSDPGLLPEGEWYPTELGKEEIAGGAKTPETSSPRQASPKIHGSAYRWL
jgi:hypothetical protein